MIRILYFLLLCLFVLGWGLFLSCWKELKDCKNEYHNYRKEVGKLTPPTTPTSRPKNTPADEEDYSDLAKQILSELRRGDADSDVWEYSGDDEYASKVTMVRKRPLPRLHIEPPLPREEYCRVFVETKDNKREEISNALSFEERKRVDWVRWDLIKARREARQQAELKKRAAEALKKVKGK